MQWKKIRNYLFGDDEAFMFWESFFQMVAAAAFVLIFFQKDGDTTHFFLVLAFLGLAFWFNRKQYKK